MPRFALLKHDWPFDHYDFMLEVDGVLATWRLTPTPEPSPEYVAERLPNHRIEYLTYEGAVSGNRGTVTREDGGAYTPALPTAGSTISSFCIDIYGQTINFEVSLRTMADGQQRLLLRPFPPSRGQQ